MKESKNLGCGSNKIMGCRLVMTIGKWVCIRCKYSEIRLIDEPLDICPKCGAKYELYEVINPHILHSIPIQRLEGTDELNLVLPFIFISSGLSEDVIKYESVISRVYRKLNFPRARNP